MVSESSVVVSIWVHVRPHYYVTAPLFKEKISQQHSVGDSANLTFIFLLPAKIHFSSLYPRRGQTLKNAVSSPHRYL
jgi:hypothetical protein